MEIQQRSYKENNGWSDVQISEGYQLVLAFISPALIKNKSIYESLKGFYPNADITLISTSGEILSTDVFDGSISVTALKFDKTPIRVVSEGVPSAENSFEVAAELAKQIIADDLKYVLVFSDGLEINGSKLVEGMKSILPKNVLVIGGLAGDNADFKETYVGLNTLSSKTKNIVMIGLYGDAIKIGNGSLGGWDEFGIERTITKSEGNKLFDLDGEPVLDLYKKYLGEAAGGLPGSGLMFPISIFEKDKEKSTVRTLLAIDDDEKSITFAGDVPECYKAYLMKANFEGLIEGAGNAAKMAIKNCPNPKFALLVSCLGRKLLLKQRVDDEIEVISDIIGKDCVIGGFYSYGEIGVSNSKDLDYLLHNQTMNIALLSED